MLTETNLRNVAKHLGPEWEELSTHLGCLRSRISQFKANSSSINNASFDMLATWKEESDDVWQLPTALKSTGRNDLAIKVITMLKKNGDILKNQETQTNNGTNDNAGFDDTGYSSGTIKDKDTSIQDLRHSLEEKDAEIQDLKHSLQEKVVEIQDLKHSREDKDVAVMQLASKLNSMEDNCFFAFTESAEKTCKIEELEEENKEQMEQHQENISELNDSMEIVVTETAEESYKATQLGYKLQENHNEIAKLQEEVRKLSEEALKKNQLLKEKADHLRYMQEKFLQNEKTQAMKMETLRDGIMILNQTIENNEINNADTEKSREIFDKQRSYLLRNPAIKSYKMRAKNQSLKQRYNTNNKSFLGRPGFTNKDILCLTSYYAE